MFRNHDDVMRTAKQDCSDSEDENNQESSLYICGNCNDTDGWSSETEVVIHQSTRHKSRIHQLYCKNDDKICKMCLRAFEDNSELIGHIKSAHLYSSEAAVRVQHEIYCCDICKAVYFNKLMLEYHISYHHLPYHKRTKFKCPVCHKHANLVTSWYHFRVHRLQSIACCRICFKKFRDLKHLAKHIKTHPLYHKCDTCGYHTKREDFFNDHLMNIHKSQDQPEDRPIDTDKYFIAPSSPIRWKPLNLMAWRGVILTNGVSICVLCREICIGEESKRKHILNDHVDPKTVVVNYLCSCGMLFTSKVLMKHHRFKYKELHAD